MSVHNVKAELIAAATSVAGSVSGSTYVNTAYTTVDRTHAAPTAVAVVTTGVTTTTPFGFVGAAQGDAISTTINQIIVDLADLKQLVNGIIADLRASDIVL